MTCGKMAFATKQDAKAYIKEIRSKVNSGLRVYECEWCGKWHTTRQSKKQMKSFKRRNRQKLSTN